MLSGEVRMDIFVSVATGLNAGQEEFVVHGFLRGGHTPSIYTTLDVPSATGTLAFGINNSGQIVGDSSTGSGPEHGFVKIGGTYTTLDDPLAGQGSGQGTFARGINSSGQIVGFYVDSGDTAHGFLYGGGVYTTIDDPSAGHGQDPRGNRGTFATGINDAGQIVGYYRDDTFNLSQTHGFLYTTTPNPAPPAPTTADIIPP